MCWISGGGGGHYWSFRHKFGLDVRLFWDVLETPTFAQAARHLFSGESLRIFSDIDQCRHHSYDIILTSGAIQCFAKPREYIRELLAIEHRFMVINRFPIVLPENYPEDWLTVQTVPKGVYGEVINAYPAWFFSWASWQRIFLEQHQMLFLWNDRFDGAYQLDEKAKGIFVGMALAQTAR